MGLSTTILFRSDDLPIRVAGRVAGKVHSGKVRSVYWLNNDDSQRLIRSKGYAIAPDAQLAVMVISDRISAFDCIWRGEGGLDGVPRKGAALNAISKKWFDLFKAKGLAGNHIVDTPHPLVWIVQRAQTLRIEAIVRGYITGSMWRDYAKGERSICGITLPNDLEENERLNKPIITPSTKGILEGIPGVPEADDVNISRDNIIANLAAFGIKARKDVEHYEHLLYEGYRLISDELARIGQIFVDTKFEFGYARDVHGHERMIYIDEVGTPDSSRIWDGEAYARGEIVERSKESFRKLLMAYVPDREVLLDKTRMPERKELAAQTRLPPQVMHDISRVYVEIAQEILGGPLPAVNNPRQEIIEVLDSRYGLIE